MRALPAPGRSRGGAIFMVVVGWRSQAVAPSGKSVHIGCFSFSWDYFKKKNKYRQQKESYNGNLSLNSANKCVLSFVSLNSAA
jgi:hypothetical protein